MVASPQTEDGYFKLSNELAEAFSRLQLSGNQWRILWAILRQTYGWNRKEDKISYTQFCQKTGLDRRHVGRELKSLINRKIIAKIGNSNPVTYRLQKDYSQWLPLPKLAPIAKNGNAAIAKNGNDTDLYTNIVKDTIKDTIKDKKEKKNGGPKVKPLIYPEWLDLEQWKKFKAHRKKMKKPLTEYAETCGLKKLERIIALGFTQEEVIQNSTDNTWLGLFEPKHSTRGQPIQPRNYREAQDAERRMLAQKYIEDGGVFDEDPERSNREGDSGLLPSPVDQKPRK